MKRSFLILRRYLVILPIFAVMGILAPRPLLPGEFKRALYPRTFRFPHDHGNHPAFQTEWWYITGNLRSKKERRWGYQFTLFRQGLSPSRGKKKNPWRARSLYMLHAAISDIKNKRFYHIKDIGRAGPGICGVKTGGLDVWMKTAHLKQEEKAWVLNFRGSRFSFHLILTPGLPPILHGNHGLSQKGPRPGQATYYYSIPVLKTRGTLHTPEGIFQVTGTSWFDHEFGTNQLSSDQAGWDWFALHLSDHSHLMVYRIRKKNGTREPTSSATYIDKDGKDTHLTAEQFRLIPLKKGRHVVGGVSYPLIWKLVVPSLKLTCVLTPQMKSQVWPDDKRNIPYWEGAIDISGVKNGHSLTGEGYMELTGYGKSLRQD